MSLKCLRGLGSRVIKHKKKKKKKKKKKQKKSYRRYIDR